MRKALALVVIYSYLISSLTAFAQEPTPTPSPTPRPPPSPEAIQKAADEGEAQGKEDGAREAGETAPRDGEERGRRDGDLNGYERCRERRIEEEFDEGRRAGAPEGEREGRRQGDERGHVEGERAGADDGARKGRDAAEQDALRDATPPGRRAGTEEAEANTETPARARRDGSAAGDKEAATRALEFDYQRGRDDVNREKFAEPILNRDAVSLRRSARVAPFDHQRGRSGAGVVVRRRPSIFRVAFASLDATNAALPVNLFSQDEDKYTYARPKASPAAGKRRTPPPYPIPELSEAYRKAYDKGYASGWEAVYWDAFERAYREARRAAFRRGCERASSENYRADYERGYREAFDEARAREDKTAYDAAYRPAFDAAYNQIYKRTYSESFPTLRAKYFADAKADAYKERTDAIYAEVYEQARGRKYAEVYPAYSAEQYRRGRADEEADFRARPVRALGVEAVETITNGLFEPDEPLRLKLRLRNFAGAPILARDVKIAFRPAAGAAAIVQGREAQLSKDLRPQSETEIGDAFDFQLTEAGEGQRQLFTLEVFYQGQSAGRLDLGLVPRFIAGMEFAEEPTLLEGLAQPFKVRLTNRAQVAFDAGAKINAASGASEQLELTRTEAEVGALRPGESRVLEFPAIARTPLDKLDTPLAFRVTDSAGRRVGLFQTAREFPVANDYRVSVAAPLTSLRAAGTTRVEYIIRNVKSAAAYRALQLEARFVGAGAENFAVLGLNPQYLAPLARGGTWQFVVPVASKGANAGGMLEIELSEAGRAVVIHRIKF